VSLVATENLCAGEVGVDASQHIASQDFSPVIERALQETGFPVMSPTAPRRTHLVGFGHASVLSVADKILDAVSTGALSHLKKESQECNVLAHGPLVR
jgi:hydroxylamine reductase (hybrid-cluster protein)